MTAIVDTKSNYRELNGKELKVCEILGTRVTLLVPDEAHGFIKADFNLNEIECFPTGVQSLPDNNLYTY